jgi:hypothetical protein
MYTLITQHAMAASPLMMGGDLPSLDDFSLRLVMNQDIIACNQNGVMGHLVSGENNIDVWKVYEEDNSNGWAGVFNRSDTSKNMNITEKDIALDQDKNYKLFNVWEDKDLDENNEINPNGVVFIRFTEI